MESPKTDAMRRTCALYKAGGTAALSVLDVDTGGPFTTLVNVAVDSSLRPLLLISALAHHSKCLAANPMASVMLHEAIAADADPMLTFRATVLGKFEKVAPDAAARFFLARHPYAELYAGFGDFDYWRMEAEHAHIIAGFGRAYGVRFSDIAALAS
jgi:heme iron utilization protein